MLVVERTYMYMITKHWFWHNHITYLIPFLFEDAIDAFLVYFKYIILALISRARICYVRIVTRCTL